MNNKKSDRKLLDLFSGIGGFSLAAHELGLAKTTQFVEKDSFCQKILQKNFPNTPIHDDIKTFKPKQGEYDFITFGSPCFVGDTPVLTQKGWQPIVGVQLGETILSHNGVWRKVIEKHSRPTKKLRKIECNGLTLFTTDEHPFYASLDGVKYDFVSAQQLTKNHRLYVPRIPSALSWCPNSMPITVLSKNIKYSQLSSDLLSYSYSYQAIWLHRFLQGNPNLIYSNKKYLIHFKDQESQFVLFHLLRNIYQIIPRFINTRKPITHDNSSITDVHFFGLEFSVCLGDNLLKIEKNEPVILSEPTTVFNLGVEFCESYCATIFGVHNCQDLSQAGKQRGLSGDRSILFYEATRIVKTIKPKGFIFENVIGARKYLNEILEEFEKIGDYNLYWYSLSAQQLGACHKRERFFCIGWMPFAHSNQSAKKSHGNCSRFSSKQFTFVQEEEQERNSSPIFCSRCDSLQGNNNVADSDCSKDGGRFKSKYYNPQGFGYDLPSKQKIREIMGSEAQGYSGKKRYGSESPHSSSQKTISPICGVDDGFSPAMDTVGRLDFLLEQLLSPQQAEYLIATHQATDSDDIPYRNKRIAALGNSVTPQQAAIAWSILDSFLEENFLCS